MPFLPDGNNPPVDVDFRLDDVCLNLIKYMSEG